ncbi:hypothetical protein MUG91_G18n4 [Manis pentadactyla]|nr:hypothetical protein MUG91_G18n4 [Manis pentadactyla]
MSARVLEVGRCCLKSYTTPNTKLFRNGKKRKCMVPEASLSTPGQAMWCLVISSDLLDGSNLQMQRCGEGKVRTQPQRDKRLILPDQQDRTFNKPSRLWKRVRDPAGCTEAEGAPAAALAAAAAAAPALLGETVPLRQGRTRLELKEASARRRRRALPECSVKALRQKKNQQFIERRSYSLSGYPTPTVGLIESPLSGKRCKTEEYQTANHWEQFPCSTEAISLPIFAFSDGKSNGREEEA